MRYPILLILLLTALPVRAEDMRTPLSLSADEIAAVQQEMRHFLAGVQQITDALAKHDMKTVHDVAIELGNPGNSGVPAATRMKLPMPFKLMGEATHKGFIDLATDTQALGDTEYSLRQLSTTLQNCLACHASYRLVERKP